MTCMASGVIPQSFQKALEGCQDISLVAKVTVCGVLAIPVLEFEKSVVVI